jgi:hypothetical protein
MNQISMKIVKRLLEHFNGLHFPQEYLCLDKEQFPQPLRVYVCRHGQVTEELTQHHAFVGYSPLLLAFPPGLELPTTLELAFTYHEWRPGFIIEPGKPLATLELERVGHENEYLLYEGTVGRHRFLPLWRQALIDVHNRRYKRGNDNVHLAGNTYRQVQIAYAMPRQISLITVAGEGGYNLFPTDLHGSVHEGSYLVSLRHEGKACQQVLAAGQIILSSMPASAGKLVYGLGKNHMQPLKPRAAFPFADEFAGLPVPMGAFFAQHLELEETRREGIHELLSFRIADTKEYGRMGPLAHVHNAYATWRYHHGQGGNYEPR